MLFDRLIDRTFAFERLDSASAAVQRRVATTTALWLARVQRDPALSPTLALVLEQRLARLAAALARSHGDSVQQDWSRGLARLLSDREALDRAVAEQRRQPVIPPGMPIGGGGEGSPGS